LRGLSLTRRVGEHILFMIDGQDGQQVVAAVITLVEHDGSRVRLQIQADPAIKIKRAEGPLELQ
jgi:sRNA-binding carbon storage regulator CsrA